MSSNFHPRPSRRDIFRYRYHHGVNLGGVFVLEQWLCNDNDMFGAGCTGGSELDAVVSSITVHGVEETRQRWERHWKNALSDDDLEYLTTVAGCDHIRLPIGYFTLGPEFCRNTPFAMAPGSVYVGAWTAVKELCRKCRKFGIGVLIDFQAAPGGANPGPRSGTSDIGAELWGNEFNLDLATKCLCFIASEIAHDATLDGVIGLQNLGEALKWSLKKNNLQTRDQCPIFIDTHRFYAFDDAVKQMNPEAAINSIPQALKQLDHHNTRSVFDHDGAVAVYIGEYACALAPETWQKDDANKRNEQTLRLGRYQTRCWAEKATGCAFLTWMLHSEGLPSSEVDPAYDFRRQVDTGSIFCPSHLKLTLKEVQNRLIEADRRRTPLLAAAMERHTSYFEKITGSELKGQFEHWRYADGWHQGYTEARAFFAFRAENVTLQPAKDVEQYQVGNILRQSKSSEDAVIGADKIGALDMWILKRMRQEILSMQRYHIEEDMSTGSSGTVWGWEWEHGYRAGVRSFEQVVGI